MRWCQSQSRLQWLQSFGVDVDYMEALPICELQPDWDMHNIGREGPAIDEEQVLVIMEADEAGAIFEPTIVTRCPNGYALLDGKQRTKGGVHNGATVIAAYVVRSSNPRILAEIARGANAINGHKPSGAARSESALELMDSYGLSAREASVRMGISLQMLEKAVRRRQVTKILVENEREPEGHINGLLDELSPLAEEPKTLVAVYDAAKKMRLDSPMQREFVRECRAAGNVKEIRDVFSSWESRPEVVARAIRDEARKVGDIDNLLRLLHGVEGILRRKFDKIRTTDKKTREEYVRLAKYIDGRLKAAASESRRLVGV